MLLNRFDARFTKGLPFPGFAGFFSSAFGFPMLTMTEQSGIERERVIALYFTSSRLQSMPMISDYGGGGAGGDARRTRGLCSSFIILHKVSHRHRIAMETAEDSDLIQARKRWRVAGQRCIIAFVVHAGRLDTFILFFSTRRYLTSHTPYRTCSSLL